MSRIESHADGKIIVARGCIEANLAAEFQEEQFQAYRDQLLIPEAFSAFIKEPHGRCVTKAFGAYDGVEYEIGPATGRVLTVLERRPEAITVNYQPPRSAMSFHRDNEVQGDEVIIVHGGDDGAFDYSLRARTPEEAERHYSTIELSAGDVVYQCLPYILHRGRNTGDQLRVTVAVAEPTYHSAGYKW